MWITYQNIRFACYRCYYMTFVPFCTIASYETFVPFVQLQVMRLAQYCPRLHTKTCFGIDCISSHFCRYCNFGFFKINVITIEPWLQLFSTANLTVIGDLRLQLRILNLKFGLQLGPTHLSVEIVTFLQLPSSLNNVLYRTVIQH